MNRRTFLQRNYVNLRSEFIIIRSRFKMTIIDSGHLKIAFKKIFGLIAPILFWF